MAELRIGTSGYVYKHWKHIFYPDKLPSKRWLQHYASHFDTVELNATFYRLPSEEAVDRWKAEAPPHFMFACKGSRFLTHLKRLKEPEAGLSLYFSRILRLGKKLGPILWQLPPQMNKADLPRLENFLSLLPRKLHHAVEFRSDAWYTEEVCALLDSYHVALCEHDLVARPPPRMTGGFRYLRFHGKTGKYQGRYGKRALAPVARSLASTCGEGMPAYVYFNNDISGHALSDAMDLLSMTSSGAHSHRPKEGFTSVPA
jgi:uncharacterized protein YecE (DUF72 family)